ncbi:MAG: PRTRC system protein C [Sulfuricaulis sp.]
MNDTAAPALTALRRRFRMGATMLDDVAPDWPPERVLAAYVPNYPFLQGATLAEPVVEGDSLVYEIRKPPTHTKGADAALEKALAEIRAWGQVPVANANAVEQWAPVFNRLRNRLRDDDATVLLDPCLVPLA